MLQKLSIKNFAIIDDLKVKFYEGFSTITGETGAGKSIILGGLGLILGNRADLSSLKDESKKCIIEGEFFIGNYELLIFFKEHDLDYDVNTIIRREIAANGKSRAFINDTPVKLSVLSKLGRYLIDIHSQHQTLMLADKDYQFNVLDALAKNVDLLKEYTLKLDRYNILNADLEAFLQEQSTTKLQYEYNQFLYSELHQANLKIDEQHMLETSLDKLNNIEVIKQNFTEAIERANDEQFGMLKMMTSFKSNLANLATFDDNYKELFDRVESLDIEFSDVVDDLERANEKIGLDPQDLDAYNDRLSLLYDLQKKHGVNSNEELLNIKEQLSKKVNDVENADAILLEKREIISKIEKELNELALQLRKARKGVIPNVIRYLENLLSQLSMPNAQFRIELKERESFFKNGKDELHFLFSANKGGDFDSLKKVASGGEMSRIMLALKALLSEHTNLPTILFDEIDAGVSGEVSNKMASIMDKMSENMQVISITHLPQIAAKGKHHYKVYKEDSDEKTITNIKELNDKGRVREIAEMLSGNSVVDSAIEHAKQLLG